MTHSLFGEIRDWTFPVESETKYSVYRVLEQTSRWKVNTVFKGGNLGHNDKKNKNRDTEERETDMIEEGREFQTELSWMSLQRPCLC